MFVCVIVVEVVEIDALLLSPLLYRSNLTLTTDVLACWRHLLSLNPVVLMSAACILCVPIICKTKKLYTTRQQRRPRYGGIIAVTSVFKVRFCLNRECVIFVFARAHTHTATSLYFLFGIASFLPPSSKSISHPNKSPECFRCASEKRFFRTTQNQIQSSV